MRFAVVAVVALLFALFSPPAKALAQGNFAVLFSGISQTGEHRVLGPAIQGFSLEIREMEADSSVFPGVEIRFSQTGRFAFGLSYQRLEFRKGPESFSVPWGDDSGQELVRFDESMEASSQALVPTLYVNILTRGKVRPFVAIGGGPVLTDVDHRQFNIQFNRDIVEGEPWWDQSQEEPQSLSERYIGGVAKGMAGVNVFPARHLVLSLGGGYFNGPAVNFGAGVTF